MSTDGKDRPNLDSPQVRLVCVTVACSGHADFCVTLNASVSIRQIKLSAMQHFNLELPADHVYSLRHNGVALQAADPIGVLDCSNVDLTLELERASRFGETLFLR